jgi:hypothetical protein
MVSGLGLMLEVD